MKLVSVLSAAQSPADNPGVSESDWKNTVHCVDEVFSGQLYRWFPTPEMLITSQHGADAVASLQPAEKYAAPSVLVRLDDAIVAGSAIFFPDYTDRTLVYETFRPNDRPATPLANADDLAAADESFLDTGESYLFLGSAGSFNYGHWLVDDLPRAKAWLDLVERSGEAPTILLTKFDESIDKARVDSLRRLIWPSIKIEFLARQRPYRFTNLYYSSPVSYHPIVKHPAAMEFVYRAALRALPNTKKSRRLFVQRISDRGRSVANQAELDALLTEFAFETIDPGTMTFEEQLVAFREASIVIGVMGAGMTNVLFCPPATVTIYLAPAGWLEPFYWDLAVVRGHQYHVLYGDALALDCVPHLRDFTIDIDALRTFLAASLRPSLREFETSLEG